MTQLSAKEYQQIFASAERLKSLSRIELLRDPWAKALLAGDGAQRFLSSRKIAKGDVVRGNFVVMVADCVLAANSLRPPGPTTSPRKADKVRKAADRLRTATSDVVDLPPSTTSAAFRDGLQDLCEWEPEPPSRTRSRRGIPERRAFIVHVAQRFYANFRTIHTEAAGEIVMLLWPNTLEKTIRDELSTSRKAEIIEAFERQARIGNTVDTVSQVAFARMTVKRDFEKPTLDEEQLVAAIRQLDLTSGNTALRQALHQAVADHLSNFIAHENVES
jgi:hypothetical protein